jgi:hypothetical protein
MGLNFLGSSSGSTIPPNPNPEQFSIVTGWMYGEISILEVHYIGCTPYNGNKILVYEASLESLQRRIKLDPHFLENDSSPIARFPANEQGRRDAKAFALLKVNGRFP